MKNIIKLVYIFTFVVATVGNNSVANATEQEGVTTYCDSSCQIYNQRLQQRWDDLKLLYNSFYGSGSFESSGYNMAEVNITPIIAQITAKCIQDVKDSKQDCVSQIQLAMGATSMFCSGAIALFLKVPNPVLAFIGVASGLACDAGSIVVAAYAPQMCDVGVTAGTNDCMKIKI